MLSKKLILVAGKPGSGKTTAAELAASKIEDTYYFSIGAELRAIGLHNKPSRFSKELKEYADELKLNKPVPAHLAISVFEECMHNARQSKVIVDGYPQYPDRLPAFNTSLARVNAAVLAVCEITVTDEVARARMLDRGQRSLERATSDEYATGRLQSYYRNLVPTLDILSGQYARHIIDGLQPIEEVADNLVKIINDSLAGP